MCTLSYEDMRGSTGSNIIRVSRLQRLLHELAKQEPRLLREKHKALSRWPRKRRHRGDEEAPKDVETAIRRAHVDAENQFMEKQRSAPDHVRFLKRGYGERYYQHKLHITKQDEVVQVVDAYVRGLFFVMRYYYVGTPSWSWYYPYHYAPLVHDLAQYCSLPLMPGHFKLCRPLPPFGQLLAVLPPRSAHCLPEAARKHLKHEVFELDLNGKSQAWMCVALLPFFDEARVRQALVEIEPFLTSEERVRNTNR